MCSYQSTQSSFHILQVGLKPVQDCARKFHVVSGPSGNTLWFSVLKASLRSNEKNYLGSIVQNMKANLVSEHNTFWTSSTAICFTIVVSVAMFTCTLYYSISWICQHSWFHMVSCKQHILFRYSEFGRSISGLINMPTLFGFSTGHVELEYVEMNLRCTVAWLCCHLCAWRLG